MQWERGGKEGGRLGGQSVRPSVGSWDGRLGITLA